MNIYFSCSITGGRSDQVIYQQIVDFLVAGGHQVPTAHLSKADVMLDEHVIPPADVYERDTRWVSECELLIAEVSTPSHGVGYEIALALLQSKPVFCCYRQGRAVSKMILGNSHPSLTLKAYSGEDDLLAALQAYIERLSKRFNVIARE